MKKYYLITLLLDGIYANTFIEGSITRWMIKRRDRNIVILNSWRISKKEYKYALNKPKKLEVK